jgi:hypothetical protein
MSLCSPPSLTVPLPSIDLIALLKTLLAILGITPPQMPTIPMPALFCPLD